MIEFAQITLNDETEKLSEDLIELVGKVIEFAIKAENLNENVEVSITFVTDEAIQELNRDYRDKDEATDVLSFAMNEGEEMDIHLAEGLPDLLGDIIISLPRAEIQAKEYGHDLKRELCFLAVHGFLHLLGYDHGTEEEEKEMFLKQEDILNQYGIKK